MAVKIKYAAAVILFIMIIVNFPIRAFGQEGWINQSPTTLYPGLYGVYAIDTENLWAVGELGLILHSMDGGDNWNSLPGVTIENLYTVEFINADTGWVAGDDDASASTVLRTVDGGENWEAQFLSEGGALPIYDLDFIKGQNSDSIWGYITGGLGFTWKTEDFGTSWGPVRNDCENTFYASHFVNKDTGWFVGTPSVKEPYTIMHTSDGGDTWQEQTNPTGQYLRGVSFGSDQKGIAVGLSGTKLYTSDGGATWEASAGGGFTRWESVFLRETGKAWAVGSKGAIAYSTDWGHTWVPQESGDISPDIELWEVYFVDDQEGWIVGGGLSLPGVILHTTNGGIGSGVNVQSNIVPKIYRLEQNTPNPFSSYTRINYSIPESAMVNIKISNAVGQIIEVLIDQKMPAGNHHINFDTALLPEGIYYYCMEAGSFSATKKMMLLK